MLLELTYNHVYDPIIKLSVEFCHCIDISIPCAKKVFKCQRQEKSRQLSQDMCSQDLARDRMQL